MKKDLIRKPPLSKEQKQKVKELEKNIDYAINEAIISGYSKKEIVKIIEEIINKLEKKIWNDHLN